MDAQQSELNVVDLATEQTHDLRSRVLRTGTTSTDVMWEGDDERCTMHLGVIDQSQRVVAISTWLRRRSPDVQRIDGRRGVQLRGMATDPAIRGRGVGALLLRAGIERVAADGAEYVWANARSDVLGFYVDQGFTIVTEQFESAETGIAHRRILLHFTSAKHENDPRS